MQLKQRLILHIGLHKTGSTSLQNACFKSRHLLREVGIEYPDAPELTGGTNQHVLLTHMLRQPGGCETFIEHLRAMCASNNIHSLLLSAEDLSTFFTRRQDRKAAKLLIKSLDRTFEDWRTFAVVREGPAMILSLLLQIIESDGYPRNLSQTVGSIYEYQRMQCRELKAMIGARLEGIDYEGLDKSAFCRSLLHCLTGADIAIPEVRVNTSTGKSIPLLMSAAIRRLWTEALQATHHYTQDVETNVARTLAAISMDKCEESRVIAALIKSVEIAIAGQNQQAPHEERLIDLINSQNSLTGNETSQS